MSQTFVFCENPKCNKRIERKDALMFVDKEWWTHWGCDEECKKKALLKIEQAKKVVELFEVCCA